MLILLLACTDDDVTLDTGGDTGGDTAADTAEDPAFESIRAAARRDLRGSNASGASVAVWVAGEIVYAEGFGTKHPDGTDPVLPTTLFGIGSDSKKIAAIAALQQVAAGGLSLDDTLADFAPEVVFATDAELAGSITLHELLSHQSGLYDYTPWIDAPADTDLAERAAGRFAENEYAMGPSGLYWSYANPNFSVAGLASERADGRMWGDIVEDDIFAPLGMDRTYARQADAFTDGDYAVGYGVVLPEGYDTFDPFSGTPGASMGVVEDSLDCGFTRPAGLVWSTASDMARLGGFLVDGDDAVLSDELRGQLTTAHVPMYPATDAADFGYGYGLMVNSGGWSGYEGYYADVPLWAHGGNTMSMTSTFYVLPEQRVVVSVLSNGYGNDFTETAVTALEALADLPDPLGVAPSLLEPAADVEEVAGTWVDAHGLGTVTVTWDGTDLLVDAPDLEALGVNVGATLEPYAKDLYFLTADGTSYDLNFYRGDDGTNYLVNRQFTFASAAPEARRAPAPAPRALVAPALDPRDALLRLLGPRLRGE